MRGRRVGGGGKNSRAKPRPARLRPCECARRGPRRFSRSWLRRRGGRPAATARGRVAAAAPSNGSRAHGPGGRPRRRVGNVARRSLPPDAGGRAAPGRTRFLFCNVAVVARITIIINIIIVIVSLVAAAAGGRGGGARGTGSDQFRRRGAHGRPARRRRVAVPFRFVIFPPRCVTRRVPSPTTATAADGRRRVVLATYSPPCCCCRRRRGRRSRAPGTAGLPFFCRVRARILRSLRAPRRRAYSFCDPLSSFPSSHLFLSQSSACADLGLDRARRVDRVRF